MPYDWSTVVQGILSSAGSYLGPADLVISKKTLTETVLRAEAGSVPALGFLKAQAIRFETAQKLKQPNLSDKEIDECFAQFRAAHELCDVGFLTPETMFSVLRVAEQRSTRAPLNIDVELYLLRCPRDQSPLQLIEKCKTLITSFPDDADLWHILGCFYGFAGDNVSGYESLKKSVELSPGNFEMLYAYGRCMTQFQRVGRWKKGVSRDECVNVFKQFVEAAPRDHRNLPEAYYTLGTLHIDDADLVNEYYDLGVKAEDPSVRLPIVPPVNDFQPKQLCELVITMNITERKNKKSAKEKDHHGHHNHSDSQQSDYVVGQRVTLHGLKASFLNGAIGEVVEQDWEHGRVHVMLTHPEEAVAAHPAGIKVKPANLKQDEGA